MRQRRYTLQPGQWTQISTEAESNVTIENYGVGAYQSVRIAAGAQMPAAGVTDFRTVTAQLTQTFTNLDEGTILWATAASEPTAVEVITG